jgi:large subunit ribosomal protein L20
MARIKRGVVSKRKHNKLLTKVKGYRGTNSTLVKVAKQASLHADAYSYQGRKNRKRDMRRLWILRIGEAVKKEGISYSVFINQLKKAKVEIDRKILSEIIVNDSETFTKIVKSVK